MKKNKIFACGIAIGLISTLTLQAFGAPVIEKITAYINHEFEFEFDGIRKAVPEGYHVLVYEGRSYVPAKFVAENLGGSVAWNEATKVISIQSPEPVIVTAPAVVTPEDAGEAPEKSSANQKDSYDYRALSQTKDFDGLRISAISYSAETQNIGDRLYLSISNNKDGTVQLDQMKTKFIVDGKEYSLSGKDAANFDTRWYSDIQKDQTVEGYLRLPPSLKDMKKLHIELTVHVNRDFKTTDQIVTFDIAL